MKKIICKASVVLFITLLSILHSSIAQEITNYTDDGAVFFKMIENTNQEMDKVLLESKPAEMSLAEYKGNLVNGKVSLAEEQQNKIMEKVKPLADYGYELAKLNNIETSPDDLSTNIGYAIINARTFGFRIPDITINEQLTWGEVADCAVAAIGGDAIWGLGGSGAATWSVSAITKAFTAVAKRFLGPIGVAIAGVTFAVCLVHESTDHLVAIDDDTKPDYRNTPIQIDKDLIFIPAEP